MTREQLKQWQRIDRHTDGALVLKIISGRAVIQCIPFAPDGRYFKPGDSSYYIAPDSDVVVIAIWPTEIEWKPALMLGFGGSVSKELSGGVG